MITTNDLFDLYYSFLLIRDDIKYELNSQILSEISKALLDTCDGDNCLRKILSQIEGLDRTKWGFVLHNNCYTFQRLVRDRKLLCIISEICLYLKLLIDKECFEEAYDFVDSIHYIPLLIEEKGNVNIRTVRALIKRYSKKCGKRWKIGD